MQGLHRGLPLSDICPQQLNSGVHLNRCPLGVENDTTGPAMTLPCLACTSALLHSGRARRIHSATIAMSKRPLPTDSEQDSEQDSGEESNVLDTSDDSDVEEGEGEQDGSEDEASEEEEGSGGDDPTSPPSKHKRARANSTDARFALPAEHETAMLREKIVLDAHPGAEDDARQLLVLEVRGRGGGPPSTGFCSTDEPHGLCAAHSALPPPPATPSLFIGTLETIKRASPWCYAVLVGWGAAGAVRPGKHSNCVGFLSTAAAPSSCLAC